MVCIIELPGFLDCITWNQEDNSNMTNWQLELHVIHGRTDLNYKKMLLKRYYSYKNIFIYIFEKNINQSKKIYKNRKTFRKLIPGVKSVWKSVLQMCYTCLFVPQKSLYELKFCKENFNLSNLSTCNGFF